MPRTPLTDQAKKRGQELAKRIRAAREKKGWTQTELAVRSHVSLDTIRSIEGARILAPGVFVVHDISMALRSNLSKWLQEAQ